ncbi:hypothetical protein BpHYR1_054232 [Brachionus plicatilis]|uniref:Uncharacterized protein n=1 Tax=Brachionus plicatilis TaxID=10195 RepID=A0A3M7SS89_BRAPC|nr:hypothetical protein BpHYR1_054232 [Brachionus plicatilis]
MDQNRLCRARNSSMHWTSPTIQQTSPHNPHTHVHMFTFVFKWHPNNYNESFILIKNRTKKVCLTTAHKKNFNAHSKNSVAQIF